jgi:hypothetical protein
MMERIEDYGKGGLLVTPDVEKENVRSAVLASTIILCSPMETNLESFPMESLDGILIHQYTSVSQLNPQPLLISANRTSTSRAKAKRATQTGAEGTSSQSANGPRGSQAPQSHQDAQQHYPH